MIIQLPREARLRGRVVRAADALPAKPVLLFNPSARLSLQAIETDNDGTFQMPGLMAGSYYVIIDGQDFMATLHSGRTTDVKFDLADLPAPPAQPLRPGR